MLLKVTTSYRWNKSTWMMEHVMLKFESYNDLVADCVNWTKWRRHYIFTLLSTMWSKKCYCFHIFSLKSVPCVWWEFISGLYNGLAHNQCQWWPSLATPIFGTMEKYSRNSNQTSKTTCETIYSTTFQTRFLHVCQYTVRIQRLIVHEVIATEAHGDCTDRTHSVLTR